MKKATLTTIVRFLLRVLTRSEYVGLENVPAQGAVIIAINHLSQVDTPMVLVQPAGEYLFEIIMRRHEKRSTIMTSNRPIEEWGKLVGDVPAATAILDRFLQHAEIINITGKSYRMKDRATGKPAVDKKDN